MPRSRLFPYNPHRHLEFCALKHFNVVSTVLILIVGVWVVVEFRQRSRRFPESRLDNIWLFLAFYDGLVLASFFSLSTSASNASCCLFFAMKRMMESLASSSVSVLAGLCS